MILKFEDDVFAIGPSYEYINSDKIARIRLKRKRIYIYLFSNWNPIFVGRTKHNMDELKRLYNEIEF